jgi:hypothetical protein
MLLSLFLLLVPIVGLSCGTDAGKHLDGVEGAGEDAAALIFLHFFGVECVDVAPPFLFFFFVALFFGFFISVISLTFLGLTALFFGSLEDGSWIRTKANGPGAAASFEAQADFDVLQVYLNLISKIMWILINMII